VNSGKRIFHSSHTVERPFSKGNQGVIPIRTPGKSSAEGSGEESADRARAWPLFSHEPEPRVAGHVDGIKPLIDAFKREKEAHVIAVLARSLAETGRNEAIEALIAAIREQKGVAAYEAYRALKETYRVSLSLDANAWQRWLDATRAFRE
jgi:hypothetical protein